MIVLDHVGRVLVVVRPGSFLIGDRPGSFSLWDRDRSGLLRVHKGSSGVSMFSL